MEGLLVLGQFLEPPTIVWALEKRIRRDMEYGLETYVWGRKITGEEVHEQHLVCLA